MKIEKISKLKNDQYKIKIDNEEIITYDDVILKYGILFKKDIDFDLYDSIMQDTFYYKCYNKALKYALKHVRCIHEMRKYIDSFDLTSNDKDKILNKLINIRIIDDLSYTKAYINDKLLLSKDGPDKIINNLRLNNIDDDIIEKEISNIDNNLFIDKLSKMIIKKINSNHKYSNYQLTNKIVTDMVNLGYKREDVIDIIESNLNNDYSLLIKEYNKQYKKLSKKYSGFELESRIRNNLYQKGFRYEDINKEDLL